MTNKVKFTLTRLPIDRCVNNEGQIPEVPANPRTLGKKEFERLKKKLRELDFTAARPLIAYPLGGQYVVFCGNQRLRALREIGETEINAAVVPEDMSAEELRKILLADNVSDGEWDLDVFANGEFPIEEAEWAGVDEAIWNTEGVVEKEDEDEDEDEEDYKGKRDEKAEELLREAMRRNTVEFVQMVDYCMQAPFGAFLPDGRTIGYAQAQFIKAKYYNMPYHGKNSFIFIPQQFFCQSRQGQSYYDVMKEIAKGKEAGIVGFRTATRDGNLCQMIGNQYRIAAAAAADFPIYAARYIYKKYYKGGRVLDPCHGWGGRLVAAMLEDVAEYVGCDPSPIAHAGVSRIYETFKQYQQTEATLIEKPYEDTAFEPCSFDFAFTCPPYFDVEKYAGEETSTNRYPQFETWCSGFFEPLITKTMQNLKDGGVFCIVVGSQAYPLKDRLRGICDKNGYGMTYDGGVFQSNMHGTEDGIIDSLFIITKQ